MTGTWTYAEAELIQVISAVVMPKSLPTYDVMTVMDPPARDPMAIVIVAVRTNRVSCMVELKHAGRASGSTTSFVRSWVIFFSSKVVDVPPSATLEIAFIDILESNQEERPLGVPGTGVLNVQYTLGLPMMLVK